MEQAKQLNNSIEKTVITKERLILLEIVMFLTYAFFSASWLAGSTLTKMVVKEFGLNGVPASINNAISIAKIIGNFLAAWFLMKLGPKKASVIASILISCVFLGAFTHTFPMFIATRFLMGFGGALFVVYMASYVMYFAPADKRVVFNGINGVAANVGNGIALLTLTPVMNMMGTWRNTVMFYGGCSIVLFILWMLVSKDFTIASKNDNIAEKKYSYFDALKDPFLYAYVFTYIGLFMVFVVMVYLFPLNPSFTISSKTVTLLLVLGSVLATIVGTNLAKRLPVEKEMWSIRISGILLTLDCVVLAMTKSASVAMAASFLCGFFMFISVATFATLPMKRKGATAGSVSVIVSLYWCLSYILQMIFYTGIVSVVNNIGWSTAIWIIAAGSITWFLGSFLLQPFFKKD